MRQIGIILSWIFGIICIVIYISILTTIVYLYFKPTVLNI